MNFLHEISKILSNITGISETPIFLTIISLITIIIIDLITLSSTDLFIMLPL